MKLKLSLKSLSVIIILPIIAFLLIWAFVKGRKELAMEQERERAIKATSRVSIQDSEMVLTLDRTTQIESEITVVSLTATSHREEFRAYGIVLPVQELVDLRNSFATAKAQVEKSRVNLDASRREYERLNTLHEDNRNISEKVLQKAEAIWRSDEVNVRAAEEALHALEVTARQQWGAVLSKWLFDASQAFEWLISQKDILIQITLPSGEPLLSPPQTALVRAADGTLASATLVSPSPPHRYPHPGNELFLPGFLTDWPSSRDECECLFAGWFAGSRGCCSCFSYYLVAGKDLGLCKKGH